MLIGTVIEEFGKTNIIVNGFVEAKYCEATPTTLKFTHETWEYVHKETEKKFSGQKIVGWIHTHPDFGIFLSEYDKFIQQNFFKEDYQIAYVIDPIRDIEGFYFWINGNIERCKGFYKFDKMGAKIEGNVEPSDSDDEKVSLFNFKNIIIVALVLCVMFLTFCNISQNREINSLKKQQDNLVFAVNQTYYMQQTIADLQTQVANLEKQLKETTGTEKEKFAEGEEDQTKSREDKQNIDDIKENRDTQAKDETMSSTKDEIGGN